MSCVQRWDKLSLSSHYQLEKIHHLEVENHVLFCGLCEGLSPGHGFPCAGMVLIHCSEEVREELRHTQAFATKIR